MTTSSTFPRSSAEPLALDGAAVVWTGRTEGDLATAPDRSEASLARLTELAGRPVAWLHQVHGTGVVVVAPDDPGRGRGEDGDALVTSTDTALAVTTADCAPLALSSPEGVIAAVHAGWRGLLAGVVQAAVASMRALGAGRVSAALGPCIHPECYPFGADELDALAARFGPAVRFQLPRGGSALHLPAAVGAALDDVGARLVHDAGACTACSVERYFSHRARGEVQRQAMVVWKA